MPPPFAGTHFAAPTDGAMPSRKDFVTQRYFFMDFVARAANKRLRIKKGTDKLLNARSGVCTAFVIGAMFIAGQAKANVFYNWSLSVPGDPHPVTGAGLFSTAAPISGLTQLLTFTGTVDGIAITALLAPNTYGGNDNNVLDTFPQLNSQGLSFSLASTDAVLDSNKGNIYSDSQGYTTTGYTGHSMTGFTYSPVPTGVPEPASLALMVTALAGLATVQFRRQSR